MARFRNPRFAPEFLERKLSPSSLLAPNTTAVFRMYDDPEPLPKPSGPWLPPLPPPVPETLPILPG